MNKQKVKEEVMGLVQRLNLKLQVLFNTIAKYDSIIIILIVISTLATVISSLKSCTKESASQNFVSALQDSLKVEKNKNGQLVSSISVLQVDNTNTLLAIKTKDKTLLKLQEELKKTKKANVTVVETNTSIHESLVVDNSKTKFNFENQWIELKGETSPNPYFDLIINNKPVIKQYVEDGKMVVEYSDENPYVSVTNMRSFSPLPKKTIFDKIKIGPGISYVPFAGGGFQPSFSVIYSLY